MALVTRDGRIEEVARLLVERSLDVQPGWQVSVRTTPLSRPLTEAVVRAIGRRGAYALLRMTWGVEAMPVELDWALEAPEELLGELSPIDRYAAEHEDARLVILAPEDVHRGSVLADERRRLVQQARRPSAERARSLDLRWAVFEYPTEARAHDAGMTVAELEEFVYGATLRDWDAERRRLEQFAERFDAADEVRIVGADTDLTLSIAGREGTVDHGLRNMPGGEFFYSPIEDSAEGMVSFSEFPALYQGRDVAGARLVFREGRVVDASAETGEDLLLATLDTDEGARRLGELGLGCNEAIQRYTRNTLWDEKIAGTVHLALGASYTYTGGRNDSAIHWDLVKDLRAGGEVWCDAELVQKDGRWLL